MLNICIIDDDKKQIDMILDNINNIMTNNNIQGNITYQSTITESDISNLTKNNDIILLDIEMPDINGMDVANLINDNKGYKEKPFIIFLTNRDDLVYDALTFRPYDFIRKSHIADIEKDILFLNKKLSSVATYLIKNNRDYLQIPFNEIIYINKTGNYIEYVTIDNIFKERKKISEVADTFAKEGFIITNNGCLVNPKYIKYIGTEDVILTNNAKISISKKYRKEIKEKFLIWRVDIDD